MVMAEHVEFGQSLDARQKQARPLTGDWSTSQLLIGGMVG